jgi:hypothetical protein
MRFLAKGPDMLVLVLLQAVVVILLVATNSGELGLSIDQCDATEMEMIVMEGGRNCFDGRMSAPQFPPDK